MLSRLLKEHQARQSERRELQERRRRDAITAATRLTEALVDHLNVGPPSTVGTPPKPPGPPVPQEIGDVENWARSIEMDMRTIATALEYVYKEQLQ
ncbi:BL1S1 protein, partial [Cephalopterus ornatus]|nr:BL1S1 protein [Cephalopterus ornatus]